MKIALVKRTVPDSRGTCGDSKLSAPVWGIMTMYIAYKESGGQKTINRLFDYCKGILTG